MPNNAEDRVLHIGILEDIQLAHLLQLLQDLALRWVYAERMEDTGLGTLSDLLNERPLGAPENGERPGVPVSHWLHGRAFNPDLELDWWSSQGGFYVRILSESPWPKSIQEKFVCEDASLRPINAPHPLILHGTHDKGSSVNRPTWSVARIPRYLAYPVSNVVEPPERVVAIVQDYARQGMVVLNRLLEVTGLED